MGEQKSNKLFEGLDLRPYPKELLLKFHRRYSFKNKRVMEIGSDVQLQTPQAMLRMGASEVVAVNPQFGEQALKHAIPGIRVVKDLGEHTGFEDGSFDVIFGIALLEHVHEPFALAKECSRLLHINGACFLQGNPVWTSYEGHHAYTRGATPGYTHFTYSERTSPYEAWEHLCLDTKDKACAALAQKGVPENMVPRLAHVLLEDAHVSRITPTEIIEQFKWMPNMTVHCRRTRTSIKPNAWFERAAEKYSRNDLKTTGILITMRHSPLQRLMYALSRITRNKA